MLRSLQRVTFRRCVHSSATRPSAVRNGRVGLVLGASAVVATYATWNVFFGQKKIALDSLSSGTAKSVPLASKGPASSESLATTQSATLDHNSTSESVHKSETVETEPSIPDVPGVAEEVDEYEGGGGAFNPVTGEINWDCPCLGGMAHGICGPQFREAFSCFVFSEKEPKGIDCVEKFKAMQDCFRAHPDVYGEDIMDDDDDDEDAEVAITGQLQPAPTSESEFPLSESTPEMSEHIRRDTSSTE